MKKQQKLKLERLTTENCTVINNDQMGYLSGGGRTSKCKSETFSGDVKNGTADYQKDKELDWDN